MKLYEIKISRTSKLDGVGSWSLQAGVTCPASICPTSKKVKPACVGCYAKKGNYHRPNVKEPRKFNQKDWKRPEWVEEMKAELDYHRYFRFFDSGDIYHPKLAEKIYQVMKITPWVKFWIPTMSFDIPKIKPWVDKMVKLPNVVVRKSSGEVDGSFIKGERGQQSTIYTDEKQLPKGVHKCPVGVKVVINKATGLPEIDMKTGKAKLQKSCSRCTKCWDKKTKKIAYLKH